MPAQTAPPDFARLLATTQAIAAEVAALHADDVDARARFPAETVDALRAAGLLSAAVPREFGGAGCTLGELGQLCAAVAQGCAASGMVLAMHHIEVACIARHAAHVPWFQRYLRELVERQWLIASVTSEVGTFGETRESVCAVERPSPDRIALRKDATTVSYGQHADALLVTARRAADAAANDQVLVLFTQGDYTLEPTSPWDTLGMRGTCSPGGKLTASAHADQVLPGPFAESSAQTMVPYSHVLWSSVWWGVAADAIGRAAAFVRGQARKNPGSVPPAAHELAQATAELQALRAQWVGIAAEFDAVAAQPDGMAQLLSMGWALKLNNLKVLASETAPRLVHHALQVIGVMGYKNDSKFSVGRHYRDVLSAALMISNQRLMAKSASMLLVLKDA